MAMGRRKRERQDDLWVSTSALPRGGAHPFYDRVNAILNDNDFDAFVESACRKFYADQVGRPSLAPAIYFRLLMIGYFEGIDSERGIAWRLADSLALRRFAGFALTDATPDHSTISRNRRLIDLETHQEVFTWMLQVLAKHKLLDGKTIGVDATTLEANAALRSIVRRDTGESYQQFLTRLAVESGIETPTRQDLAKLDKHRKNKGSNDDWEHPHDPDAKITKMKDSRTHLAHKAEHAVDMNTGALLAVTLQPANRGDTTSVGETIKQTDANLVAVMKDAAACDQLSEQVLSELVADKGYHSNAVLTDMSHLGIRGYISEPDRGRRDWKGKSNRQRAEKSAAQAAVYGNRRRVTSDRGRSLMKKRGELIERGFAHCYDTGGMRRTHLRGHGNILKRLLIHASGFNLSLILRKTIGCGTPRGLQSRSSRWLRSLWSRISADLAVMLRVLKIRAIIVWWLSHSKPIHPTIRYAA
jgi:transposase